MRAVVAEKSGGPEVLAIVEVPKPVMGAGEVLIKVVASGVNRADVMQRQGFYPPPPGSSTIIGLECSGHIAAVGEEVSGWRVGDPCVALLAGGGYGEFVAAPAGQVIPPPPGVDLVSAGGLLEVAATVVSNLDHVHLKAGERFLVHGGSGGIGTFAIQYAKAIGAHVATTAGSADKLELCRALGADRALDYHADWPVLLAAEFGPVDVILDVMGASYLEANVGALALDGRLVVIGLQGGRKATLDLNTLLSKRGTVTATSLRFRPVDQKTAICARVVDTVWPMIASGAIRLAPETRIPAEQVVDAHRQLESGRNVGKIILTW